MARDHIEFFRQAVAKVPDNDFARYSLAMEYRKAGRLEESLRTFEGLLARDSSYVPAYLMAAEVAGQLGEIDKAKDIIARGTAAALKAGEQHAADKLGELLQSLG